MRKIIYFLVLFFVSSYCSNNKKIRYFDFGKVKDNIYTNDFFKFSFSIPDNWYYKESDYINKLVNKQAEDLSSQSEEMEKIIEEARITVANLLMISKYKVGSTFFFNPTIAIMVDNISGDPGIKSEIDYIKSSKRVMERTNEYNFDPNFYNEMIGNKKFDIMKTNSFRNGIEIYQEVYVRIIDNFALNIIITYSNQEEKKEIDEILLNLNFK